MFCLYTSSKLSHPKFEFSLKVMRSNTGYLVKPFLLYRVNLQFTIWHFLANFVLMCLVSRWSGAHDRALAGIYGVEYSALDAYQLLISVNSCFIVIFWAQFSTVLFMITHPRHKLMTPPSYVWSHSVHRVRFSNVDSTSPLKSLVLFEFMLFNIQLNIHRAEL